MNEQSIYWKPKFYVTAFALVTATFLVLIGKLGGGEWVAVVNIGLATYVAGSVAENRLLK